LRHEINSENTRRALADAMKSLINQSKSADKITIDKIVKKCGVNRNTFYYHFAGIEELLLWTLRADFYLHIQTFGSSNGTQIREFAVNYLNNNQKFLTYAYQYLGYNKFRDSYTTELYPIILDHIKHIEERDRLQLSPAFEKFVAEFYAEQVGALYLMQFQQPDYYHKEGAMKCLEMIFDFSIPDLLSHEAEIDVERK